jgi:hypothetical protein
MGADGTVAPSPTTSWTFITPTTLQMTLVC